MQSVSLCVCLRGRKNTYTFKMRVVHILLGSVITCNLFTLICSHLAPACTLVVSVFFSLFAHTLFACSGFSCFVFFVSLFLSSFVHSFLHFIQSDSIIRNLIFHPSYIVTFHSNIPPLRYSLWPLLSTTYPFQYAAGIILN